MGKVTDSGEVAKVEVEKDNMEMLDEMMKKEVLQQKRKDEMETKKVLLGIRDELHATRDSFVSIEKYLDGSVTSSTDKKVDEVRRSLKDVLEALSKLKADVNGDSK